MAIRVVVTVTCLGLFLAGSLLPSPLVEPEALAEMESVLGTSLLESSGRMSWTPLGIMPFVTGFLVIEILSLVIPFGRQLRRAGVAGRRTINRTALAAAFVVTWVQSYGIATFVRNTMLPSGASLTTASTALWTFTVAAGTFAAVGLAALISRFGLGNGFVVLFVGQPLLWALYDSAHFLVLDPSTDPENRIMNTVITGLFFGLVVFLFRRPRSVEVIPAHEECQEKVEPLRLHVPALPQGVAPLSWVYVIPGVLGLLPALAGRAWLDSSSLAALLGITVGVVALSVLTAWMFSAHGRVVTNLEGVADVPKVGWERVWKAQLVIATAVVLGGHVLPGYLYFAGAEVIWLLVSENTALFLVTTALDLWHEGRLVQAAPGGAVQRVVTLDNVHLAEYFRARLEREGIPHAVRAFHFRRLLFFLGPLYKMTLLVPVAEAERAAALVEATDFRIA